MGPAIPMTTTNRTPSAARTIGPKPSVVRNCTSLRSAVSSARSESGSTIGRSCVRSGAASESRLARFSARLYKADAIPPKPVSEKRFMAHQRTFSILKPDVTRRNLTGAVNAKIEAAGLRIVAQKRLHMTRDQAETFYAVHAERPFFGELVEFMTSAPVVVQVLEGDNAIQRYRDVMGATNPENASPGTIRKEFAVSMGENSVHGSDAPDTAVVEIGQFFSGNEIVG